MAKIALLSIELAVTLLILPVCFSYNTPYPITGIDLYRIENESNHRQLSEAGAVIYWYAGSWALIRSGSIPGAHWIMDRDDSPVFLIQIENDEVTVALDCVGTLIPCVDRYVLWRGDIALVDPQIRHKMNFIRLGEPYSLQETPALTGTIPSVSWQQNVQELVDSVSASQLMADLQILTSFNTRQTYTQGCFDAGNWLLNTYQSLGYAASAQYHTQEMAPNIIADLPGITHPEQIIIVGAHYDSMSRQPLTLAPGADDNGTGTIATLQIARVFAGRHFEKTIRFVAFSGEELGLIGSQAYANQCANAGESIWAMYNMDMIGWVEPYPEDIDCLGNNQSTALLDQLIQAAQVYTSLPTRRIINGGSNNSDHASFWSRGFCAVTGIEDIPINYPYYHTIDDTIDKINSDFFHQVTRVFLAATADLAIITNSVPPTPTPVPYEISTELVMNATEFYAGAWFHLGVTYWNQGPTYRQLPLFVVLEIAGDYWFYPRWSEDLDYAIFEFFPYTTVTDKAVLELVWPYGVGALSGLKFHGAVTDEAMATVFGEISTIEWSYW